MNMHAGYISDPEMMRKNWLEIIGHFTFQEAYNLTGRILNVTVTSTSKNQPPLLLNYLTAPNVVCDILYGSDPDEWGTHGFS